MRIDTGGDGSLEWGVRAKWGDWAPVQGQQSHPEPRNEVGGNKVGGQAASLP